MIAGKRPHLSPLDSGPERLDEIRAILDETGVRCAALAAYTNLVQPTGTGSEVPHLELQIAYVETLACLASQLGAGLVRVFTAYESPGQDLQTQWTRSVSVLREMADRASGHGVTLAIQNHHDLALSTDSLLDLLAEIDRPNVRLGFDAWSPALRGEPLYEAAFRAAPHTALTTNADYVRVPRHRYRPELVNYERDPVDWIRRFHSAPDSSTTPPFSTGSATAVTPDPRPTRSAHRSRAAEDSKTSMPVPAVISSGSRCSGRDGEE